MTGAPEGSPKVVLCGFMEKPGIEPATPGLQGIALIHYTTGASQINCHSLGYFTCPDHLLMKSPTNFSYLTDIDKEFYNFLVLFSAVKKQLKPGVLFVGH